MKDFRWVGGRSLMFLAGQNVAATGPIFAARKAPHLTFFVLPTKEPDTPIHPPGGPARVISGFTGDIQGMELLRPSSDVSASDSARARPAHLSIRSLNYCGVVRPRANLRRRVSKISCRAGFKRGREFTAWAACSSRKAFRNFFCINQAQRQGFFVSPDRNVDVSSPRWKNSLFPRPGGHSCPARQL